MRGYGLFAVLLFCSLQTVFAEDAQDFRSLKNAKVGDWTEFTTVSKFPGQAATSQRQREEIVALTAEQVSIQVTTFKPDGSADAIVTTVAMRKEPYGAKTTTEPVAQGAEELAVGAEKFDCK